MSEESPSGNVGSIKAPEKLPVNPAMKKISKQEKEFYEAQTEGYKQDTAERKKYAFRVFVLCCCWVSAVFLLLLFEGFGHSAFHLSDGVVLAAIGSTTANIIAVFVIVARYLFPDKGQQ